MKDYKTKYCGQCGKRTTRVVNADALGLVDWSTGFPCTTTELPLCRACHKLILAEAEENSFEEKGMDSDSAV